MTTTQTVALLVAVVLIGWVVGGILGGWTADALRMAP